MNNINTQEIARAVVTDGKVAKSERGERAATPDTQSGKGLPDHTPAQSPERAVQRTEPAAERAQRVEQAVARLNDYVQSLQRDLRFSVDEDLGRAVVRVIDSHSQEVIRQIPDETALRLARNLKDQAQAERIAREAGSFSGPGSSLGLINTRI